MRWAIKVSGLFLLVVIVLGASAHAQTSLIDPAMLSQMNAEDRQQLLQGFVKEQSSTVNQDQSLVEPSLVEPESAYTDPQDPMLSPSEDRLRIQKYLYPSLEKAAEGSVLAPDSQDKSRTGLGQGRYSPDLIRPDGISLQDVSRDSGSVGKSKSFASILKIRPFGYELFRGRPNTFAPATDIPVPSDYVIGPGDNVRVQLFGNQNETFTLLVSRDGTINFPKLGPISTNGLRFDELQSMLEQRVAKEMIGTTASVTLGRLRSIRVFVLGDVTSPGSYTVSSLSTITHALFVSGGVSDVGSLRRVQLKRNGNLISSLDLYRFLLSGDSSDDVRLQPGDVVFVPPVGIRVTVEGEVKRPAVYEIAGERTLGDVVNLSGGRNASSDQTYVEIERFDRDSKRQVLSFDLAKTSDRTAPIADGDVVRIRKISKLVANEIRVVGYVKYPGTYPWKENQGLRGILDLAGLRLSDAASEIYLPLGAIERTNKVTGIRELKSFNVSALLSGSDADVVLEAADLIIIFGRDDVAFLGSADVEAILSGRPLPRVSRDPCPGLVELRGITNSQRAVRFLRTLSSESLRIKDAKRVYVECPDIFSTVPKALPFLLDNSVGVYGEVMRPGIYPVASGTTLESLIQTAAGVTSESDRRNVEYVSYIESVSTGRSRYQTLNLDKVEHSSLSIAAGDVLNFRPVYLDQEIGSVRLMGEVRFPGTYGVVRGETLAQVLQRAGGLTENAYPYGAVFTRENARKAEAASFKRAAADLQEAVVTVVTSGTVGTDVASTATFLEGVIRRLENAQPVGRVVVQADPAVLRVRAEENVVLEPGDVLLIPKRPSSVTVAGQVLSPGSQLFKAGRSPADYIEQAGSYGQAADRKRAFIVFPDGSAKPLKLSSWNFERQDVPPGSLILVPRNAAPLNKLLLSERLLSIFSNLAISAAALVSINNN